MLRAMDSAVSGLRAHQNKLDVIGNNIANVNTFGFKSQSYSFKEAMYQTSTTSTKGSENAGGVNAAQYGYGSMMGSISTDMSASTRAASRSRSMRLRHLLHLLWQWPVILSR